MCQIGTSYADGGVHWGTGVLVSPNTVLTAAHVVCPGREIPRGFVNFNQDGEDATQKSVPFSEFKQSNIIHHPEHNTNSGICLGVDLALIKLSSPVEGIDPVKLYEPEVSSRQQGYSVGYGYYGRNGGDISIPGHYRHFGTVNLSRVDSRHLAKSIPPSPDNINANFLSGFQTAAEDGPYQAVPSNGDSGSPFLLGSKKMNTLAVAGIFYGIQRKKYINKETSEVELLQNEIVWTPIYPHLDWLRANI